MRVAVAFMVLVSLAGIALADGELDRIMTPEDKARLEQFDATRAEAIAEAKAGAAGDVAILDATLAGGELPFGSFDATGNWICRKIKLGGHLPLVVFGWFKCRISDDGGGWRLEKLTGSQRTSGAFYTVGDTRLVYLGAGHYSNEKSMSYASDADRDEVAYVVRPGKNRLRLEFPLPKYESKFDILELTR
jgi:hypothetical protein